MRLEVARLQKKLYCAPYMRRAKIVCTLGPASKEPTFIGHLIDEGMNVARINFSHGDPEDHKAVIAAVRSEAQKRGRAVAVLQDLQGPKIRVGRFVAGSIELEPGAEFTLTTREVPGTIRSRSTTYKGLPGDVKPGDVLLLDDGLYSLEVIEKNEHRRDDARPHRRHAEKQQGHQSARRQSLGAGADAERIAEIYNSACSSASTSSRSRSCATPADIDEALALAIRPDGKRIPIIAKIEKPEARRLPRRDRRSRRRHHGRARRSRRRNGRRKGPADPKARHRADQRQAARSSSPRRKCSSR